MVEQLGRTLAQARLRALRPQVEQATSALRRPPTLAVLALDDPTQRRFVQIKQRTFRQAGMELLSVELPETADTEAALAHIEALNAAPEVDGIFLQFPLPAGVDGGRCGDALLPRKDIDDAGSTNLGRLLAGSAPYPPAAPAAVITLLEAVLGELRGRSIVLVGTAGVVERCLVLMGAALGATLCILAPHDAALPDAAAGADAVVITDALPPGDAFRHTRSGAVLLDAGYFLPPRPRDWLSPRILEQLDTYLPQYGNVGPLTVTQLMTSVLQAAAAGD